MSGLARELLREGDEVLDTGTGTGVVALALAAAGLGGFGDVEGDGFRSPRQPDAVRGTGRRGKDHVAAVADGVQPEPDGMVLLGAQGMGEEGVEAAAAGRGEGAGPVHDLLVVQDGECGVEVVETRVE